MHPHGGQDHRRQGRAIGAVAPPPTAIGRRSQIVLWLAALVAAGLVALAAAGAASAANPAADLDQCANDPAPSPASTGCDGSPGEQGWQNGNVVASQALYLEGDSVPYRMKFSNLSTSGSRTVIIEWDTTQGGKHALDYLTSWNRTVTTAKPCLGVSGCSGSPTSTFAIPADPQVTGAGVTTAAGSFAMWGGTITGVSAYSGGAGFPVGNNTRQIAITFSAAVANPVLAWGGHIATRADWGAGNSAIAISGSPYHMRLISLDGAGGNQDRALQSAAVVFPGSITIVKDASPEGATAFPFTASPAPLANFQLVDDGTATNTKAFGTITDFTTYAVAETVPSGWSLKGVKCTVEGGLSTTPPSTTTNTVSIGLKEGDNVTCTFANERQAAQLVVIKKVVNDNGGTAVPSDFTLDANGAGDSPDDFPGKDSPGTTVTLDPGAYSVSEQGPKGYSGSFSADCAGTIAAGETKTCTVTNDDIPPVLKLRKVVVNDDGGTAVVGDFILTADGTEGNDLSGTSPVDSGKGLMADTWTLSETGPKGYAGSWACEGGMFDKDMIALDVGEEATCTITNDDLAGSLKLVKKIVNDNGGTAGPADFTLTAAADTGSDDRDFTSQTDEPVFHEVYGGAPYGLSESGLAGYAADSWSCDGGTLEKGAVTVPLGAKVTCTITNDDIAPVLKLRKVVVNDDGGTAVVGDFTLMADGTEGNDLSGVSPVDSGKTLMADTWMLSEKGPEGYAGTWECTGDGTQKGDSIALAIGQEATCTATNDDAAGALMLVKKVVNDSGGTAGPADFTLTAAAAAGSDTRDFTSQTDDPVFHPVFAGAPYGLSEAGPTGYSAGSWSCDGGTLEQGAVTVPLGAKVTCTITNDDVAPVLHLRKVVVNDDGGTAVIGDFTLMADGTEGNDLSGVSPVDSGKGLMADSWKLSEKGPNGYADSWKCTGDGTQKGASITLAIGEEATCTATNDDIAATLKLVKKVVNDNGGTAGPADFILAATAESGSDVRDFTSATDDPQASAIFAGVPYDLSEKGPAGYAPGAWSCDGGSLGDGAVTAKLGETVVCAITNDDIAPILRLRKIVVNDDGGTAVAGDFTLTADGTEGNDLSGVSPVDSGAGLQADTWALGETGPDGYAGTWSCVGGTPNGEVDATVVAEPASITLGIGEEATCTVTNDDVAPQLIVIKEVVNGAGGTATAADFTLASNGVNAAPASFPGTSAPGTAVDLDAGPYDVSETGPAGYRATYSADCAGTIAVGETRTCTVTNTRLGTITVTKALSPTTDAGLFDLQVDGTTLAAGVGNGGTTGPQSLEPGTHAVAELAAAGTSLAAYTSALSCADATGVILTASPATSGSVTLADGQDVVCTFTNTAIPPATPPTVVAPPAAVLPPKVVRGRAVLRGPAGCIAPGAVTTFVTVRNAKTVFFFRDGRLAKRITTGTTGQRTYTLDTMVRPGDYTLHRVEVRVRYVTGAKPVVKVMSHRFGQCRASSVTG